MRLNLFFAFLLFLYSCSPQQEYTISSIKNNNTYNIFSSPIKINKNNKSTSNNLYLQFIHSDSTGYRKFLLQFIETGKEWNSLNQIKIINGLSLYQSGKVSLNYWGNSDLPNLSTAISFEIPYVYLKSKTEFQNKLIELYGKFGSFDFTFDERLIEKFLVFRSFVERSLSNF